MSENSEMEMLKMVFKTHCEENGLTYDDYTPVETSSGAIFASDAEEYSVMDEDSAGEMFQDMLDQYIEDCILSEIPEHLHYYFDFDSFKSDVEINDGRGPTMAPYDGHEHEYFIPNPDDGQYPHIAHYVYRIN